MRIKFDSIQDENEGFEVLRESGMLFTYLGNRCIAVNKKQIKMLDEKRVIYEVLTKEANSQ